jgi:nitrate/TMAO reductase-like tetraheme cytochrome c subunit
MIINCLICKKEKVTYPSRLKVGKGKFCSKKCMYIFIKGRISNRKGVSLSSETKRKISLANIGKKVSLETRLKLSNSRKGENNPAWKGGMTRLHYGSNKVERIRFRKEMQKLVFKRDNYTCQMCGSNGDLQVDHIQSWADYVELRFEMSNLRTLCMDCHYLITYGKPKPKDIVWGHNLSKARVQL